MSILLSPYLPQRSFLYENCSPFLILITLKNIINFDELLPCMFCRQFRRLNYGIEIDSLTADRLHGV